VPRGTQDTPTAQNRSPTGLSPSLMLLSNSFGSASLWLLESYNPVLVETTTVWAAPISLATTLGISVDFFSSGY
jgi:hypothetical protein